MFWRSSLITAAAALSACAVPPRSVEPPATVNTDPPRCVSKLHCEQMWAEAQDVLPQITGMRLRLVSDRRLETFAATGFGRLTGTATMYPVGEGSYEIRTQFHCYGSVGCGDLPARATNLFNIRVGAVPKPLK